MPKLNTPQRKGEELLESVKRALSGGAIGAASGAAVGAVTGGSPAVGAGVGGATLAIGTAYPPPPKPTAPFRRRLTNGALLGTLSQIFI